MCTNKNMKCMKEAFKAIFKKETVETLFALEERERELRELMIRKNNKMLEELRSMQRGIIGKA